MKYIGCPIELAYKNFAKFQKEYQFDIRRIVMSDYDGFKGNIFNFISIFGIQGVDINFVILNRKVQF